jgi:hypothetical protein
MATRQRRGRSNEVSDNLSRLRDLAGALDKSVPLIGMINPEAHTCRYAANEFEQLRGDVERLRSALRKCRAMVGHPDNIAFIDKALEGSPPTVKG